MARLKELRERKAAMVADARATMDGITEDATPEVRSEAETKFDGIMAEVDRLDVEIRRYEVLERAEAALSDVAEQRAGREDTSTDEARERGMTEERAFIEWMANGRSGNSEENRAALERLEERALATGTPAAGGFLIPENYRRVLEEALKAYGGIRPLATVIPTMDGETMILPTENNTAQVGSILAENIAASELDPTFGQLTLPTFMYHSGIVRVPRQLLDDSAFSMESFVPRKLVERIARATNAHFATGTGSGQPAGFLQGITTVSTAAASAIAVDDLFELAHSVDPAYRVNASWALSDDALKVIRKLKDSEGRPLWQPDVREGAPGTILGWPFVIVQEMPAVAASAVPIAFGDFSKYLIRDAGSPVMQRLEERYAEFMQVGFHMGQRHGGVLLDAGTNPIKGLAITAA